MEKLKRTFSVVLFVLVLFSTFMSALLFGLKFVLEKENMIKLGDIYLRKDTNSNTENISNSTDNILNIIDSSDINAITNMLQNTNAADLLASMPDFNSLIGSVSDAGGGNDITESVGNLLGGTEANGIFGSISSIMGLIDFIQGDDGVVFWLFRIVGTDSLLTSEMMVEILNDPSIRESAEKYNISSANIDLFLRSKSSIRIKIESGFVYFDYFKNANSAKNWESTLHDNLLTRMNERKQDFSFLIGKAVESEDEKFIEMLENKIATCVVENMESPEDKINGTGAVQSYGSAKGVGNFSSNNENSAIISRPAHLLLRLAFSPNIAISTAIIALIFYTVLFFISSDVKTFFAELSAILILAGVLVAICSNIDGKLIGKYILSVNLDSVYHASVFLWIGIVIAAIGVCIIVALIIIKAVEDAKAKNAFKATQETIGNSEACVFTVQQINIVSKFGLQDLVFKDNPNQRQDGLIDYYGDGRGLMKQREFQNKKQDKKK